MTEHDGSTETPASQPPVGRATHESIDLTALAVLRTAFDRFRADRWLTVPFMLAGLVVAAVDLARQLDPIPVRRDATNGISLDVEFYLYPTGSPETARTLGAIVDLLPQYLAWAIAIELTALLVIGLAGWLVISRGLGQSPDLRAAVRYLCLLVVPLWIVRLLGGGEIEFTNGGLIFGIPLLVLWALVLVRLFLLPVLLVDGRSVVSAVRESIRTTRGIGWTIFALILLVGLGTSLLGAIPRLGGFLSTVIVAPLHAVAAVVIYERLCSESIS